MTTAPRSGAFLAEHSAHRRDGVLHLQIDIVGARMGFFQDAGFRMPNFFMREANVVGLSPKSSAAPPAP